MTNNHYFTVEVPAVDGFYGRECNNAECARYFKVHQASLRDTMFCPYCGAAYDNDELWTNDQRRFLEDSIESQATELAERELDRILRNLTRSSKVLSYKPGNRRPRRPRPPAEPAVDSELLCPSCDTRFQVFGIFGYCPGCRVENLLLYDANLQIILMEIKHAENPSRQLRHSYGDLVSTFERFCRTEAQRRGISEGRFQNIDHTRRLFKDAGAGDIFEGVTDVQKRVIKRAFERRHIHDHNGGIASHRYIEQVPEDAGLLGKAVHLSVEELTNAAQVLRQILENLVRFRTP